MDCHTAGCALFFLQTLNFSQLDAVPLSVGCSYPAVGLLHGFRCSSWLEVNLNALVADVIPHGNLYHDALSRKAPAFKANNNGPTTVHFLPLSSTQAVFPLIS